MVGMVAVATRLPACRSTGAVENNQHRTGFVFGPLLR